MDLDMDEEVCAAGPVIEPMEEGCVCACMCMCMCMCMCVFVCEHEKEGCVFLRCLCYCSLHAILFPPFFGGVAFVALQGKQHADAYALGLLDFQPCSGGGGGGEGQKSPLADHPPPKGSSCSW